MKATRTCTVPGCAAPYRCKGYCNAHYRTWLTYGTPHSPHRKTRTQRFWEKVNKLDPSGCWLWTGGRRNGYGFFNVPPTTVGAHRYSYELANGPIPDGLVIDHICHTPLCVNPGHLQAVEPSLNNENHSGPTRNSTSGVRGVYWDRVNRKWYGQVKSRGVTRSAGRHATKEAAAEAVLKLRNSLFVNNPIDRGQS